MQISDDDAETMTEFPMPCWEGPSPRRVFAQKGQHSQSSILQDAPLNTFPNPNAAISTALISPMLPPCSENLPLLARLVAEHWLGLGGWETGWPAPDEDVGRLASSGPHPCCALRPPSTTQPAPCVGVVIKFPASLPINTHLFRWIAKCQSSTTKPGWLEFSLPPPHPSTVSASSRFTILNKVTQWTDRAEMT